MENDLLQIKIDEAKSKLPAETLRAINNVDWKLKILEMRESKGYSFSQLAELEIETELVLYGLLRPEDYPAELAKRMELSKEETNELVEEINQKIFKKIRQELIRINIEKDKKISTNDPLHSNMIRTPIQSSQKEENKNDTKPIKEEIYLNTTETEVVNQPQELKGEVKIYPAEEKKSEIDLNHFSSAKKLFENSKSTETKTEHLMPPNHKERTNITKVDPYREVPE